MKKTAYLLLSVALCLILCACGHSHSWQAATCTTPKICPDCGETEGEALGHSWVEATCLDPKVCSVCLQSMGNPLGHQWIEATCTDAKHCKVCEATEGAELGHTWETATCILPDTCTVCGNTQGDPLGHTIENWKTVQAATCTEEGQEAGICSVCAESVERTVPVIEHTPSDWKVTVQPTPDEDGTHIKICTVCGKELESEKFTLSKEEIAALYKRNCKTISYEKLSRNPGDYEDEYVKFSGTVVQVCSEAKSELYYSTYRVATSGRYKNVVYIYVDNYGSGSRILEDDYITFYGKFDGLYTYTTVRGDSVTIPSVEVEYVD